MHGRAIVLEDDIVPTPFFLPYVDAALDRYVDVERVISVGCHTFDNGMDLPETFFLDIPDCWGWGVWGRSWAFFESDASALLQRILAGGRSRTFDLDGSYPYTDMLRDCVDGFNQSWAVRWYAHAFLTNSLVLYPSRAVTSNIGFDGSGTHTGSHRGPDIRVAQRPITVIDIPLQQSSIAREAWKKSLHLQMPGIGQRLKSRLRRLVK